MDIKNEILRMDTFIKENPVPRKCPHCQTRLDVFIFAIPQGANPKPGNITICVYCETFLIFTPEMSIRSIDKSDNIMPEILEVIKAIAEDKIRRH